jgi:HK97 gp10 family phage protein
MQLNGLGDVLRQLFSEESRFIKAVKNEVVSVAFDVEANAKADVPVDEGTLRASIRAEIKADGLNAVLSVGGQQAPYAAFVEFGTGGAVEIPDGWDDVASQFKGKSGRVINQKARPFFVSNVEKGAKRLRENIKNLK